MHIANFKLYATLMVTENQKILEISIAQLSQIMSRLGLVYALARYLNALTEVIPERVITRAPSTELRENQADQDSLPE